MSVNNNRLLCNCLGGISIACGVACATDLRGVCRYARPRKPVALLFARGQQRFCDVPIPYSSWFQCFLVIGSWSCLGSSLSFALWTYKSCVTSQHVHFDAIWFFALNLLVVVLAKIADVISSCHCLPVIENVNACLCCPMSLCVHHVWLRAQSIVQWSSH